MSSIGERIRGAAQVISGIGDQLRGGGMDALDSTIRVSDAQNRSGVEDKELYNQGKKNYEEGWARMTGHTRGAPTFNKHSPKGGIAAHEPDAGRPGPAPTDPRPPVPPREQPHYGHGDRSVGVVEGGGRVAHPDRDTSAVSGTEPDFSGVGEPAGNSGIGNTENATGGGVSSEVHESGPKDGSASFF
ncbi:hypothetical protein JAAARDRAFT_262096 [Jaapia argillacea MUCL 33604]|uniref:Uncharacterized protein n=1 Tax=Jaapia argillacea MUCL 33604 TaxID=933084 RepID=A0A067Q454_9AGAM|nr:hypothetical protein JAAARDRAFT_262096 [Jaapia argillacea MUCL 33604]